MPLTLVLGPANSAKAGEVLGAYAAAAPRGALLVVPTRADAEHYSRELAGQGCVLRSVLTFTGLAERIALAAGYSATRLTGLARQRVLRRAIRNAGLRALADAASTPGFTGAAGQLISELERSLVTPQRFAAALRSWSEAVPARGAYATDVAAVYLSYTRELDRLGRVDGELFAWRALDALRLAPAGWGQRPVFFYGFDDLTPLERDAVETLARVVGVEVMVSLNFEPGKVATSARAALVAELEPLAGDVVELPAREDFYAPESRRALHHLERTLFEPVVEERIDPGAAVRLLEAAGEKAEAELVAGEVLRLLESGIPAHEIAVVLRTLGTAEPAMARTFARYGIPLAVRRDLPFAHTALGRGLLALTRCALGAGGAHDLLEYLRTPGALRSGHVADRLELAVRTHGVSELAEARGLVGLTLGEIDAVAGAAEPLRALVDQGRRLLAAPARASAAILGSEEALDARALARLAALPDELASLGELPRGHELLELLDELEVPDAAPPRAGAVLLSEPLAIRARRFRAVLVCGLQEGSFPWTAAPEPFLSDEVRRELAATSGLRLRPAEDALARERYLFYACVSRATEQVVLSYCSSDEDGNRRLPSPFLTDVEEALVDGWSQRRRRRTLSDVVWPMEEAPTARERELSLAAAGAPAAGDVVGTAAGPDALGVERRLGPAALAAVRHTQVVSAGGLESYAQCAVKWLVERELDPQLLEPTPEPLVRGSHAHRLLEQVLGGLGGPVTPESLPRALELLAEGLAELPADLVPGRPRELRQAVAEAIAADLRRYLEHEAESGGGWEPRYLELRFGFGEEDEASLPALVLGDPEQPVAVRGVIDRVDVEPGGRRAVVRDYKSGASRAEHRGSSWREGQQLQVALYMVAVRDLLDLEPVAGLYQPLGGRDLRARGVYAEGAPVGGQLVGTDARDPEALSADLEDARARAVALAGELRAGRLEPSPATCSRDGCRYPGICRCG